MEKTITAVGYIDGSAKSVDDVIKSHFETSDTLHYQPARDLLCVGPMQPEDKKVQVRVTICITEIRSTKTPYGKGS